MTVPALSLTDLRKTVTDARRSLAGRALELPSQALRIPGVAHGAVSGLGTRAAGVYGDLTVRGRDVVRRVIGQQPADDAA